MGFQHIPYNFYKKLALYTSVHAMLIFSTIASIKNRLATILEKFGVQEFVIGQKVNLYNVTQDEAYLMDAKIYGAIMQNETI